jgi:hypothetical protein
MMTTKAGARAAIALLLYSAALGGCKSEKESFEEAAAILCKAAQLAEDPPEAALKAFAKKMNTPLKNIKKSGRDAAGGWYFAEYILAESEKLSRSTRREIGEMLGMVTSVHSERKYKLLKSEFAEHGVKLDCPALKRRWRPMSPENPADRDPAPASKTGAGDEGSIGVPECDAYIDKYARCISEKIPKEQRQLMRKSLHRTHDVWKKSAADPQARKTLGASCRDAMELAKKAMAAFECDWGP